MGDLVWGVNFSDTYKFHRKRLSLFADLELSTQAVYSILKLHQRAFHCPNICEISRLNFLFFSLHNWLVPTMLFFTRSIALCYDHEVSMNSDELSLPFSSP